MTKQHDYEKKMEALNWRLKNSGYEIVGLHGARSTGFYTGQANKGLKYIEDKFDYIIERLNSWEADEKGIVGMRIKGIGIVFNFKRYSEEETKARNIMNEMGLGERQPEYKERAASITVDWHFDYLEQANAVTNGRRVVAWTKGTDKLFEVRFEETGYRTRYGKRIDVSDGHWNCEWEDWQPTTEFDRFKYSDILEPWNASQPHIKASIERQMKKILRAG